MDFFYCFHGRLKFDLFYFCLWVCVEFYKVLKTYFLFEFYCYTTQKAEIKGISFISLECFALNLYAYFFNNMF